MLIMNHGQKRTQLNDESIVRLFDQKLAIDETLVHCREMLKFNSISLANQYGVKLLEFGETNGCLFM